MKVTIKSEVFGDRTVNINISSKPNVFARTGDGRGNAVKIARTGAGMYQVVFERVTGSTVTFNYKERKAALESAAKFLAPISAL